MGIELHDVALGHGLSLLGRDQPGDALEVVDELVGDAAQVAAAVLGRELRPERLDLGDVGDDAVDVRSARSSRPCRQVLPSPG